VSVTVPVTEFPPTTLDALSDIAASATDTTGAGGTTTTAAGGGTAVADVGEPPQWVKAIDPSSVATSAGKRGRVLIVFIM
jgi:hypothetical protein